MGDQDDRLPLALEVLENAKQVVGFCRGKHAGGFVKDEDVGAAVQRLEDLNPLLHADADIFDDCIRIDVQFVFVGQRLEFAARTGQRGAQKPAIFGPKHDVFKHGEVFDQLKVLEHHADARRNGGLAVGDRGFLTGDENFTSVSLIKPVQN